MEVIAEPDFTETITETTETLTETLENKNQPKMKIDKRKNPRTQAQIEALAKARLIANTNKKEKAKGLQLESKNEKPINEPMNDERIYGGNLMNNETQNFPTIDEVLLEEKITQILNKKSTPQSKFRFENGYYVLN